MGDQNLHQYPWYFGKINRQDCETHLTDYGEDEGCFLVRESNAYPGSYTVSALNWDGTDCSIGHYLISKTTDGRVYFDEELTFDSLPELIEYYQGNPSGLTFSIKKPCPKESKQSFDDYGYAFYEVPTELAEGDHFIKENLIYTGTFSKVWKGKITSAPNQTFVAKIGNSDDEAKCSLTHEANMLKYMIHENVVRLRGVISKPSFTLILHDAGDTSLLNYLLSPVGPKLSTLTHLNILKQIVSALDHCRVKKIVHRAVKAKSIIINSVNFRCKLAGFRYARVTDDYGYYHAVREEDKSMVMNNSRVRWMAIEAAKDGRFSMASDVWSFAILLVEVFSNGGLPYAGFLTYKVLSEISSGYRCPKPSTCPKEIYELMKRCWDPLESNRPTFKDIKSSLKKYYDDNRETLNKLEIPKAPDWSRYSMWKQPSFKQPRTSSHRTPPSSPRNQRLKDVVLPQLPIGLEKYDAHFIDNHNRQSYGPHMS